MDELLNFAGCYMLAHLTGAIVAAVWAVRITLKSPDRKPNDVPYVLALCALSGLGALALMIYMHRNGEL